LHTEDTEEDAQSDEDELDQAPTQSTPVRLVIQ
jgi:hypothetical protein